MQISASGRIVEMQVGGDAPRTDRQWLCIQTALAPLLFDEPADELRVAHATFDVTASRRDTKTSRPARRRTVSAEDFE